MRGAWLGALRDGRGPSPALPPARAAFEALRDLVLDPPADRSAPRARPEQHASSLDPRADRPASPAWPEHPASWPDPRADGSAPPAWPERPASSPHTPADRAARPAGPERRASSPAPALAVLCRPEDARAVAVGAASLLARRFRCGCALACVWTPAAAPARAAGGRRASGQARRLGQALEARGLAADACGRATAVALPAPPEDAVTAARRAIAAAAQAPTVLVLGGPRDGAFDPLLAEHDLVVALTRPGESDAVAALALAGLGVLDVRAMAGPLTLRPVARSVAGAGLAVPSALRRALDGPLRELG